MSEAIISAHAVTEGPTVRDAKNSHSSIVGVSGVLPYLKTTVALQLDSGSTQKCKKSQTSLIVLKEGPFESSDVNGDLLQELYSSDFKAT